MSYSLVILAISTFVGFIIGVMLGEKTGYDRGCQDTHDYYHAKGLRK